MTVNVRNVPPYLMTPCQCCHSWLEHWQAAIGDHDPFCSHAECLNKASTAVGVHNVDSNDRSIYLVPVCAIHKRSLAEYPTLSFLVPMRQQASCRPQVLKQAALLQAARLKHRELITA
jgi:hypothetical protein